MRRWTRRRSSRSAATRSSCVTRACRRMSWWRSLPSAGRPGVADAHVAALTELADDADFRALVEAIVRITRIVPADTTPGFDAALLTEPAEAALGAGRRGDPAVERPPRAGERPRRPRRPDRHVLRRHPRHGRRPRPQGRPPASRHDRRQGPDWPGLEGRRRGDVVGELLILNHPGWPTAAGPVCAGREQLSIRNFLCQNYSESHGQSGGGAHAGRGAAPVPSSIHGCRTPAGRRTRLVRTCSRPRASLLSVR